MERIRRKLEGLALPVVLMTVFVDVLGVGILLPILPQLIFHIFIPAGFSFDSSLIILGWLMAIYPLMMFFSTPILGQMSDRYGRKKVLLFCLAGTALGYMLFALGILHHNIFLLFLGRAIDGVTGGNISVARAVIADVSPPQHRARNFGIIGAAFGAGFVLGPYIGARLALPHRDFFGLFHTPHWFNPSVPFWFSAILAIVNLVMVWLMLSETHTNVNRRLKVAWTKSLDNIRKAALRPGLRAIFGAEFLFWSGLTFFINFFEILLIQRLGFSQANVGDLFAYIGVCIVLSQVLIVPVVARRFGEAQVLRFSLLGAGVALLLQLAPQNATEVLLVAPLVSIFMGLTIANASALVSRSASKEEQGEVLGIEASVQSLAQAVPAVIGGYIAARGVETSIVVGSLVILAGGLIFNFMYHGMKRRTAPPRRKLKTVTTR